MNRRQFLVGTLASLSVAGATPSAKALDAITFDEVAWVQYIQNLVSECFTDLVLYGTYAVEHIDTYPFVRRVPPEKLFDNNIIAYRKPQ